MRQRRVSSPAELGSALRSKRRALGVAQAEVAGLAGVGVRFLSELERGKPTAELGKVMAVVATLGLELELVDRHDKRRKP